VEAPRFASLTGLGFGDCGKGLFTDALCRRWPVHTVVRFNGGAQAGHNVVLPDGRHHTFSQFGSGSFVRDVATLLASEVVVHPTALQVEEAVLRRRSVADTWSRLIIDERCRVTTPYHQAAGRLREWHRGTEGHGSCGVGVGETVRHSLQRPDQVLRYGDLLRPALALEKLAAIREALASEFDLAAPGRSEAWATEVRVLQEERIATRWLAQARDVALRVPPAAPSAIAERLHAAGTVLFEGAQGMLLDEWRGFHPYTTWSSVGPTAAQAVLADIGITEPMQRLGILRTYLTRHGAGPLPTQDAALDELPEPHNASDGWQGAFRRGHPDAVLLRYAIDATGPLDGLLLSHLDALQRTVALQWCSSYFLSPAAGDDAICEHTGGRVTKLRLGMRGDLGHQKALTRLLCRVQPQYEQRPLSSVDELRHRLEAVAGCPVRMSADGATHRDVVTYSARGRAAA